MPRARRDKSNRNRPDEQRSPAVYWLVVCAFGCFLGLGVYVRFGELGTAIAVAIAAIVITHVVPNLTPPRE